MTTTKIKAMRLRRGVKASYVAKQLKVTRSCVCLAEKKGIYGVKAAARYAAVLQCKPEELLEF